MEKFAVVEINNKQYFVQENKYIKVDRVNDAKINVLSVTDGSKVEVGAPYLTDYGVELELIENKKDKKITVSRFRNKSRYRKNKGFRASISVLKVNSIGKSIETKLLTKETDRLPKKATKKVEVKDEDLNEVKPLKVVKSKSEVKPEAKKASKTVKSEK